jgi:hypothetical protein
MTQLPPQQLRLLPGSFLSGPIPPNWVQCWGSAQHSLVPKLEALRSGFESLADGIPFTDYSSTLAGLVGSADLKTSPVHRWYYYKEGFSPLLPWLIADHLGAGTSRRVVDPFAGVATTALALGTHPSVDQAIGVEYSPLAEFLGRSKIESLTLDPMRLRRHIKRLCGFVFRTDIDPPSLASFHNRDIFTEADLALLLSARKAIREDAKLNESERNFFLLGLAAIVEDVSGAMKDGRALRILGTRKRRGNALIPEKNPEAGGTPRARLVNQWRAMIEDLEAGSPLNGDAKGLHHLRGDARDLSAAMRANDATASLSDSSVGLFVYSPPYLNCIDYTEVYKLELWLLEFVSNEQQFREVREGTLRSHPSIEFPSRPSPFKGDDYVFTFIEDLSKFLAENLPRAPVGRIVRSYFEDMFESLVEQLRWLEPGGHVACVVGNSTFARRTKGPHGKEELWRLPVLTDVILVRLAEAAGFESAAIWGARDLRPRNVASGSARESVVIARKPSQ